MSSQGKEEEKQAVDMLSKFCSITCGGEEIPEWGECLRLERTLSGLQELPVARTSCNESARHATDGQ